MLRSYRDIVAVKCTKNRAWLDLLRPFCSLRPRVLIVGTAPVQLSSELLKL